MTQSVYTLQPPTREFTDEELNAGGKLARELMIANKQVNCCAQVLVYGRQLYSAGKAMLQQAVKDGGGDEVVFEAIVRSMGALAHTQENTSETLIDKLTGLCIPMLEVQSREARAHFAAQEKAAEKVVDEQRRTQEIPIGWGEPLVRGEPCVLIGHGGAIRYVMGKIITTALAKPETLAYRATVVAHLVEALLPNIANAKKDQLYVQIGANRWINAADSERKFEEAMYPWRNRLRANRIDLLLIDNVLLAREGLAGGTAAATVAGTQRILRKWAKAAGAGLVLGFPSQEEIDWTAGGWRELSQHTRKHLVTIQPGSGLEFQTHYRILIDGVTTFDVERGIVE